MTDTEIPLTFQKDLSLICNSMLVNWVSAQDVWRRGPHSPQPQTSPTRKTDESNANKFHLLWSELLKLLVQVWLWIPQSVKWKRNHISGFNANFSLILLLPPPNPPPPHPTQHWVWIQSFLLFIFTSLIVFFSPSCGSWSLRGDMSTRIVADNRIKHTTLTQWTWQTSSNLQLKPHNGRISSISTGISEAINPQWVKPALRFQQVAPGSGATGGQGEVPQEPRRRKWEMFHTGGAEWGSTQHVSGLKKAVMRWWPSGGVDAIDGCLTFLLNTNTRRRRRREADWCGWDQGWRGTEGRNWNSDLKQGFPNPGPQTNTGPWVIFQATAGHRESKSFPFFFYIYR